MKYFVLKFAIYGKDGKNKIYSSQEKEMPYFNP